MLIFKIDNLIIRPLKNSDAANYTYQSVLCDRDELFAKTAVKNKCFDPFLKYLNDINFLMNLETYYLFGAFKSDNKDLVGFLEVTLITTDEAGAANVGYEVFKQFQNNGYGTSMLKCCTQIAKVLDIEQLLLYIELDNIPSNRIAKKAEYSLNRFEHSCTVGSKTFSNVNVYTKIVEQ